MKERVRGDAPRALHEPVEALDLPARGVQVGLVRRVQMREDAEEAKPGRAGAQHLAPPAVITRAQAEPRPPHSGVDLDLEGDRRRAGALLAEPAEGGQAGKVADRGDEPAVHGAAKLIRKHRAVQHDGLRHADSPQFEALANGRDPVAERARRAESGHHALHTKAVTVRLDHGDDSGRGGGGRADAFQIAQDGGRAHFHPCAVAWGWGGVGGGGGHGWVGGGGGVRGAIWGVGGWGGTHGRAGL